MTASTPRWGPTGRALRREIAHVRGASGIWFEARNVARAYLFELIEVFYNRQRTRSASVTSPQPSTPAGSANVQDPCSRFGVNSSFVQLVVQAGHADSIQGESNTQDRPTSSAGPEMRWTRKGGDTRLRTPGLQERRRTDTPGPTDPVPEAARHSVGRRNLDRRMGAPRVPP